jgi:hypothetical protein
MFMENNQLTPTKLLNLADSKKIGTKHEPIVNVSIFLVLQENNERLEV